MILSDNNSGGDINRATSHTIEYGHCNCDEQFHFRTMQGVILEIITATLRPPYEARYTHRPLFVKSKENKDGKE